MIQDYRMSLRSRRRSDARSEIIYPSLSTTPRFHTCIVFKKMSITTPYSSMASWGSSVSAFSLYHLILLLGFACHQFSKAFFPMGIIARESMKVSAPAKVMMYAPIMIFFGYEWWYRKEYPRSMRPDWTSEDEE